MKNSFKILIAMLTVTIFACPAFAQKKDANYEKSRHFGGTDYDASQKILNDESTLDLGPKKCGTAGGASGGSKAGGAKSGASKGHKKKLRSPFGVALSSDKSARCNSKTTKHQQAQMQK